jgi:hypothetical protein
MSKSATAVNAATLDGTRIGVQAELKAVKKEADNDRKLIDHRRATIMMQLGLRSVSDRAEISLDGLRFNPNSLTSAIPSIIQ